LFDLFVMENVQIQTLRDKVRAKTASLMRELGVV